MSFIPDDIAENITGADRTDTQDLFRMFEDPFFMAL